MDPSELQVTFNDMAYGGDAVGRSGESGMAVFGWPAIKGERATVTVTERRHNLLRGLVSRVEEQSPLRVEAPCPYFGPCGGCQWQHINYDGQVAFKNGILANQMERLAGIGGLEGTLLPPSPSPAPYGYRNTSHFALSLPDRKLAYFRRDSHSVVAVDQCPISNAGINAAIPLVNALLVHAPGVEQEQEGPKGLMRVWQVTIRSSEVTGQTLVVFHSRAGGAAEPRGRHARGRGRQGRQPARPDEGPSLELDSGASDVLLVRRQLRLAVQAIRRDESLRDLALTVIEVMEDGTINMMGSTRLAASLAADLEADTLTGTLVQGQSTSRRGVAEEAHPPLGSWIERLGNRNYWVAPEAFFQANTGAAETLLADVLAAAPANTSLVVDAHAGVGTFSVPLAERAQRVICFESNRSAVLSGRWTARTAGLNNLEYGEGRAEQLWGRLPASDRPDLVLLDPPRAGCHPTLLNGIAQREVPRIIYISCDPSTLARDVKLLSPAYELSSLRMVDMFPQTFHIEAVAVLDRRA